MNNETTHQLNILIKRARMVGYTVHHGKAVNAYTIHDPEGDIIFHTTVDREEPSHRTIKEVWRRWFQHRWNTQS